MTEPVFVLAQQRSGTTAFRGALQHSRFLDDLGEVFHPNLEGKASNFFTFRSAQSSLEPWTVMSAQRSEAMFDQYVDHLRSLSEKQYVLVDVKYNLTHHFNHSWHPPFGEPNMLKLIRSRGHKLIHLTRDDTFGMYFSERFAVESGRWHYGHRDPSGAPDVKVHIHRAQYQQYERTLVEARQRFEEICGGYKRALSLRYERLFDGLSFTTEASEALRSFLGVDLEADLRSEVRRSPVRMEDAIINLSEVRDLVDG